MVLKDLKPLAFPACLSATTQPMINMSTTSLSVPSHRLWQELELPVTACIGCHRFLKHFVYIVMDSSDRFS